MSYTPTLFIQINARPGTSSKPRIQTRRQELTRKHRSVVVADGLVARRTFASDISGEAMSIDAMRVPSEVFSRISDVSTDS